MSFIEIIGKVALGQAVAEVNEKLKKKKYNEQVDAVFNQTISEFHRIIFLCQKSIDFGEEIFNLAEGKSARIDRLFEAAAAYAQNPDIQGVEPYLTPSEIWADLKEFSHRLLDGFRQVGTAKLGELPQAFNKFDRDINSYSVVDKTPDEKPEGPPPVYLPRRRNPLLKHFEDWVAEIEATLGRAGKAAVEQKTVGTGADGLDVAITGQGGIGKTAMANEYAWTHLDDYPGGVFWLQIDLGLAQALAEAARGLGWEMPENLNDQQVTALVLNRIRQRPGRRLFVLDNLEEQVIPAEVNLPDAHLLVTTRHTDVDLPPVRMDLPAGDEALDIFLGYAGSDRARLRDTEERAAREICERVGNLPLALEILGKVVRKRGLIQLASELDVVIKEKATVHGKGEVLSIGAALDLARSQYGHTKAVEALKFLGYFHAEHIEPGLLGRVIEVDDKEAQEILDALAEFSVIQPRPETGEYAMHRLVQEAARELDPERESGKRFLNFLDFIIKKVSKKGAYKEAHVFIPQLLSLAELRRKPATSEDDFPGYEVISDWAVFLFHAGPYTLAAELINICLGSVAEVKGKEHADYVSLLNNLALVLKSQGQYAEAESLYRRVLAITEKTIGPEHPSYAIRLNNLAGVLESQSKYAEAESLYRRAMAIDKETIGPEHPDYAIDLNNLAGVLRYQGKYAEAESLYRRALAITEKTIGPDHPTYAVQLNNLAGVLESRRKYVEAESLYRHSLAIDEKTIGPDHSNYATHLNNLAGVLRSQGKLHEAESNLRQAVAITLKALGPEHPQTRKIQENLEKLLTSKK